MLPPLLVVRVPPVIVLAALPAKFTTELNARLERMVPPVFVKVPPRLSVPPLVASSVPLLATAVVGAICKATLWLALMIPWLFRVKASPPLLMPIWPEPWIVLPALLVSESPSPVGLVDPVGDVVGQRQGTFRRRSPRGYCWQWSRPWIRSVELPAEFRVKQSARVDRDRSRSRLPPGDGQRLAVIQSQRLCAAER